MDTVRFGRVLGVGARHAAKTLLSAADAAAAPNPRPQRAPTAPPSSPPPPSRLAPLPATPEILPPHPPPAAARPQTSPSRPQQAATAARGVAEGSRRFGRAVWRPAVRLSGVLWLELTGVFFALFALVAAIAAWKLRSALHAASTPDGDHTRLLFAAGMVLVFGYFSLSSFTKAHRRGRRP